MQSKKPTWLMGTAAAIMLAAIVGALISAQWKHEQLPAIALGAVLVLTVVKSRWVVMDFMGLRKAEPRLSGALICWVSLFAFAAAAKAALAAIGA